MKAHANLQFKRVQRTKTKGARYDEVVREGSLCVLSSIYFQPEVDPKAEIINMRISWSWPPPEKYDPQQDHGAMDPKRWPV